MLNTSEWTDHQLLLNLANSIREEKRKREREREGERERREREGEREYSGQLYIGFHGCAVN